MSARTANLLRAVRAKIDTPEKWTTHAIARDASGNRVGALPCPPFAMPVSFCLVGACHAVTLCDDIFSESRPDCRNVVRSLRGALERRGVEHPGMPVVSLSMWQDAVSTDEKVPLVERERDKHAEVIALIDEAITAEEETAS